jgi:hypothetical protein
MTTPGDPISPPMRSERRSPWPGEDLSPVPAPSQSPGSAAIPPPAPGSAVGPPAGSPAVQTPAGEPEPVLVPLPAAVPEARQPMTNAYEFLRHLTLSSQATDNMIRLIWAITGVSVILVGIGGTVLLILPQYRMAGSFGMATAVIAGLGGAIWRSKKWRRRRAKRSGKV